MQDQSDLVSAFLKLVVAKYRLYSSLFLTLPFAHLADMGVTLPLFAELCRYKLEEASHPATIMATFFCKIAHTKDVDEQIKTLFLMVQFIERQIVLFDAIEDAAFPETNALTAKGTFADFIHQLTADKASNKTCLLLQNYRIRIVLTAHPTQFYSFSVLEIIRGLTVAIKHNNLKKVTGFLLELGKTPFRNKKTPSPLDEAKILIYYLENIFYPVMKSLQLDINNHFFSGCDISRDLPSILELGFWPGGDRDGNPNVTVDVTLKVANLLKGKILKKYIQDISSIQEEFSFVKKEIRLVEIKKKLSATKKFGNYRSYNNCEEFIDDLRDMQKNSGEDPCLKQAIESVVIAAKLFGFYFSTIDLRQDSHIHTETIQFLYEQEDGDNEIDYQKLSEVRKVHLLVEWITSKKSFMFERKLKKKSIFYDVIYSFQAMKKIQQLNGEKAANRYIISNTQKVSHVLEIIFLAQCAGWSLEKMTFDIVPLFETIVDLQHAVDVMSHLYSLRLYKEYLKRRHNQQTIMLGFSDGTKDGGYIAANWEIFCCKKRLFELSEKMGVQVIFFDGRGGPPARGGGNTHLFYRAMEGVIKQRQIQLTIQGQTISSKFGTRESASYNIEQLLTSGLLGPVLHDQPEEITEDESALLTHFAKLGYEAYQALKQHPLFTTYLETITPLNFFSDLNIASRPPRRKGKGPLRFEDLRAISFVSSWSQIKQNIPGFYGIGTALQSLIEQGKTPQLKALYQHSLFFRTLLENAMQSLLKSNFNLTRYLSQDELFGEFWNKLCHEAELSIATLKIVSNQNELLATDPVIQHSIEVREQLVLPLLVIQQYAMLQLRGLKKSDKRYQAYRKLILKCLSANINASRNSA